MPLRPLALVSLLAVGDYTLWNWSLGANHDVWALVSGLTLPPLALAWLWLLALTLGHALGHARRRTSEIERDRARRMTATRAGKSSAVGESTIEPVPASSSTAARSSGKLAA